MEKGPGVSVDSSETPDCFSHCQQLLRDGNRQAWLASLFCPADKRPYVQALYAFDHEIARIPSIVSEPALGEIRLQWWREVLEGERVSEAAANPVSAALMQTIVINKLPAVSLVHVINARVFDLYNDPMPTLSDLEGYCGEIGSTFFRLAAIILCDGENPGGADACGHAGVAFKLTQLLQALPKHAARGQCYVPKDVLARHGALPQAVAAGVVSDPLCNAVAEVRAITRSHLSAARAAMHALDKRAWPALVLLSQVEPLLRRMERGRHDPFADQIVLPQWRSQWAMWRW
jgi:15-cis-phytoene synthase